MSNLAIIIEEIEKILADCNSVEIKYVLKYLTKKFKNGKCESF
jgi:hypothetical protein